VSVPADLIRRRPDVRAAERTLAAATAQVGVAIAARYPSVSLSGSLSFSGSTFASLLGAPLFALGPSVSVPILDGKLEAPVNIARARVDEARFAYRSAVLKALQDVADAMSQLTGEERHRRRLSEALVTAQHGVGLSQLAFRVGAADFLTVLTAQRALDQAGVAVAQSEAQVMVDEVALFKALGGGYAVSLTASE
jgi:multidrug efflux system outer membrane protein